VIFVRGECVVCGRQTLATIDWEKHPLLQRRRHQQHLIRVIRPKLLLRAHRQTLGDRRLYLAEGSPAAECTAAATT
jgi:hypothetical protein